MTGKQIVELTVLLLCVWGSAALFLVLGIRAEKCKKPVNFWAGKEVDAHRVSDVTAYNHENAVMWKVYSIPFWLSGLLFTLGSLGNVFMIAGLIVLFSACFPGLFFLIRKYKQIEKDYIV